MRIKNNLKIAFLLIIVLASGCAAQKVRTSLDIPDQSYPVIRVIDGDTIEAMIDGAKQSIRMIGINAPECMSSYTTEERFGPEARDYLKFLLEETEVRLQADPTQSDKDIYGRLLRYVFANDGRNVNLDLIAQGYAREYTHIKPYLWQEQFLSAEAKARSDKRGMWAEN